MRFAAIRVNAVDEHGAPNVDEENIRCTLENHSLSRRDRCTKKKVVDRTPYEQIGGAVDGGGDDNHAAVAVVDIGEGPDGNRHCIENSFSEAVKRSEIRDAQRGIILPTDLAGMVDGYQ